MTAMTSAIRPPTIIRSSAWHARSDGGRDLTRHGRFVPSDVDREALLAARPFDRHVGLAGRHREALRVDQEVLNERFHFRIRDPWAAA